MTTGKANQLLGYPPDARLLIINADDFGMSHAGNAATLQAVQQGIATSTTLMVPCPWSQGAMRMLREHPNIPFGIHLTMSSEFADCRWGPVASKSAVPTLLDESGYFFGDEPEQRRTLLARASLDEVEAEYRAQIEAVLNAQLRPTHLDWHCLPGGGRPDIFDLTLTLAREYGLALRSHDPVSVEHVQRMGLPTSEFGILDSYRLKPDEKAARYAQLLRELPAGLSEWAVHPSLGDAEARALEPETWRIRRSDYDFLISREASDLVAAEGIVLLDYRALQAVWVSTGR